MRGRRLVTLTAALSLALLGCGSDDGTEDAGAGQDGADQDGAGQDGAATDGGSEDGSGDDERLDPRESPLVRAIGADALFGGDTDELEAQQIAAEETIRECMAEQGFEYTPDTGGLGDVDDVDQQLSDPVAYARENGFGIADSLEGESEREDPNEAYVESLDESARDAYDAALYGEDQGGFDVDEDGNPVDEDGNPLSEEELDEAAASFEPSGCQAEGFDEAFAGGVDFEDETFQRIDELYTELEAEVQADPRVQELEQQYATCMDERGYEEVEEQGDAFDLLFQRQEELGLVGDPTAGMSEEELAELEDGEADGLPERPEPDAEALAELRSFEVDLAVASAECNEPVQQELLRIQFDAEQELVDDPANAELIEEASELFGGDA